MMDVGRCTCSANQQGSVNLINSIFLLSKNNKSRKFNYSSLGASATAAHNTREQKTVMTFIPRFFLSIKWGILVALDVVFRHPLA